MLSLARVSTRMGRHYYSADNYYTQNKDVERSEWFGVGAERLGLSGAVSSDVFQSLLEGKNPSTNLALTPDHENIKSDRRAAVDLTFSAPKSVSLAALVGADVRLVAAHERAVDAALSVCEERYSLARSGGKYDRREEATGNLIVAKFHHDTSRAKDPQLHTHCVTVNAVLRADGVWRSLHNDGIFNNSKLLGLIYQNELARSVRELGYNVEVKPNGTFEIAGYSEEQLRAFSKRREKIEELGAENQKEARELVMVEREAKGKQIPHEVLLKRWNEEAAEKGIVHPKSFVEKTKHEVRLDTFEVIKAGTLHATERDVSFKREQVELFALENNLGNVDWKKLEHEFRVAEHGGAILHAKNGRLTTQECLGIEKEMLSALQAGSGTSQAIAINTPNRIAENTIGLTDGQKEALTLSLSSADRFVAWQGVAGAGKTFAMNILREEAEARRWNVRGFAPSAEAAKVLESEGKMISTTVAALLVAQESKSKQTEPTIWIVDEAGLLSAKECRGVMQRAEKENARVIFVGDTRQLSSVGAGNPFKLLQENGIATASLSESRRQKDEDLKLAVAEMAAGNVRAGLARIDESICELKRQSTRIDHATKAYLAESQNTEKQVLVLAGTNRERDLLTQNIRKELSARNEIGEGTQITTLRGRDLTPEEIREVTRIAVGDVIALHRSYPMKNLKAESRCEVLENNGKTLRVKNEKGREIEFSPKHFSSFTVYEKHEAEFAVGDKARFTRNNKAIGVRNGQDAVVESFDEKTINLKSGDNTKVAISRDDFAHIDHNYVNTVYSSQGKTCDHVIVCADDTFGKEAMYVAVSRAKFGVQIFCEDKEKLFALASESHAKLSAAELVSAEMVKIEKESAEDMTIAQPTIEPRQEKGMEYVAPPKQEVTQSQTREVEYDYSIGM